MLHRTAVRSLLVASLLTVACDDESGPLQVRENAFAWSDRVPAGATVTVRSMNGDTEVSVGTDDTVRVTARVEWRRGDPDKTLRMSGSRQGDDALICAVWGEGSCGRDNYTAKFDGKATDAKVFFTVTVPAGVKLDLQGVNGDVTASASAPVRAHTVNGNVRVATAVGPVDGATLNGSVDLRMSSLVGTDSVIAKTLNGSVFVYLPDPVDAAIDLGVTNGSVETEFPLTITGEPSKRSIRAVLGAGTRTVHARSMNGRVALRRLAADGTSRP
jgi:hypothetical protein